MATDASHLLVVVLYISYFLGSASLSATIFVWAERILGDVVKCAAQFIKFMGARVVSHISRLTHTRLALVLFPSLWFHIAF